MEIRPDSGFRDIYDETYPMLVRIACNITGNLPVSEELCQEAFIKYLSREMPLPSRDETKYWLIRVVKNLCYNQVKRNTRELKAYNKVLNEPKPPEESGEITVIKKETNMIIREALQKLPEKLKAPLVLKEYGDLSYREIAAVLKISEGNVKVRIFRARNLLETLLDKEELHVS